MAGVLNDFLGGYNAVTQAGEGVRQQVDRGQLRRLAPRAIAGDPSAQVQAAAIDPSAAQQFGAQRDDLLTRSRGYAKQLQAALTAGDPAAIALARQEIKPFMDTLKPGTAYPLDMDPAQELQGIEQFLGQTAALERQNNQAVGRVIGNNLIDPITGAVIYEGEETPVNVQYVDVPDGRGGTVKMLFNPRTQQFTRPNFDGQPEQAEGPSIPMSGPNGNYTVSGNLTPEELAIVQAAEAGGVADQVTLPTRNLTPAQYGQQSGGQRLGYTPPKADADKAPPAGYRWGAGGGLEFIPGGPADPDNKSQSKGAPTEGERKAATLLSRLAFSEQQLADAVREDASAASPNVAASVAGGLPFIGEYARNKVNPEARQRVEAAQLDILDAALTLGTGAAYTKEQLEGYRRSYFPQLGDDQGTVADKSARLRNVIEAAKIAAGRAAPTESPTTSPSALPPGFTWGD